MWKTVADKLNNQSRTPDKMWSSTGGLGEVLTNSHRKTYPLYEMDRCSSGLD